MIAINKMKVRNEKHCLDIDLLKSLNGYILVNFRIYFISSSLIIINCLVFFSFG